ncbi:U5 small nuclear ribonucleoprotein TSSC4 isoform 1-T2 [Lycodopsis pacificus]
MCDQKNGGDHGEMLNSDDVDELSASDESEPEELPSSAPFDPLLDDDDDDDGGGGGEEVEISAPAAEHKAQTPFSLRGGGSAFSNRSHSIFECLDSVARLASSSLTQDHVTDGVFTRPLPPRSRRKMSQPTSSCPTPAKKRGVPDYLVHPERWTHYNLEDVEETSDRDNRRAAHHFLSSLQQRKEQQESKSDTSCNTQQKMVFSRPSALPKEQPADKPSAVGGKEKATRLRHLEEEDEEGREKEMAGERRTDQSVEKAEERARDEEKDTTGAMGPPEEKKRVQKEKQEEEEKEEIEEANPAFTPFKKTKRMNYRKSSGQEDN